jgi:hypothetical protein
MFGYLQREKAHRLADPSTPFALYAWILSSDIIPQGTFISSFSMAYNEGDDLLAARPVGLVEI